MRFVPSEHDGVQIAEFDAEEILNKVIDSPDRIFLQFESEGRPYAVNMAAPRYNVFKRSVVCACCGIICNRVFLEPYFDETVKSILYRFSFYAETKYKSDSETHLILFTVDHIVPKKHGGPDHIDNYQTMCWPCNLFKEGTGLPLKTIRENLWLAGRIWRGCTALHRVEKTLKVRRGLMNAADRAAEHIMKGIEKARLEYHPAMLVKMQEKKQEAQRIRDEIQSALLEAQISGIDPELVEKT